MLGFVSNAEYNRLRNEYEETKRNNEMLLKELEIEREISAKRAEKNCELLNTIDKLKNMSAQPVSKPSNAGRKQRATPEQADRICCLRQAGMSLGKIAKIMTVETTSKWNKMTISNTIKHREMKIS